MAHISESDHRRLEAIIFPDHCVVESHLVSDASRGLRRLPVTKVWRTERLLGRGGFGEVHLQSQESDKNEKRALKVIPVKGRKPSLADYQRELTAMIEFTKPKYKDAAVFVDFFGWFQNDDAMFLAMEYMPLGDLEHNLLEIESSPANAPPLLSEGDIQDIARQILEGLKIMHAEGFAHRDLKPQNIFVVQRHPQWWVKLGDFGLTKKQTHETAYRTHAGTQQYMAPEMFYYVQGLDTETSEYTNAIDLWSLGCIIFRIVTGRPLFPSLLNLKSYCMNKSNALLDMPPKMEEARKFLQELLMPHPAKRPSASTALESTWLTAKKKPQVVLNDVEAQITAINISQSQNNYNTASHIGLQSLYSIPNVNDPSTIPSSNGPMLKPSTSPIDDSVSGPLRAKPQPTAQKDTEYHTALASETSSTIRHALTGGTYIPSNLTSALQLAPSLTTTPTTVLSSTEALQEPGNQASVQPLQEEYYEKLKPSAVQLHTTRRELAAKLLLQGGYDVTKRDLDKGRALREAAIEGHEASVWLLLDMGADTEAKGVEEHRALHLAARYGHIAVTRLLLEEGADIEAEDNNKLTALHYAVFGCQEKAMQLLLENGANFEAKNAMGQVALHYAVHSGREGTVQLLLEKGANIEIKDNNGQAALHHAALSGYKGMVQLILEKGADIEIKDNNGQAALHHAARSGYRGIVQLLLEKGADIEIKDEEGRTALHFAVRGGRERIVQLLLEKGADIEIKDKCGETALRLAASRGYINVAELLVRRGAKIEARDEVGRTALHRAAINRHAAIVDYLLKKGAKVGAKDRDNTTALDLAIANKDKATERLLKKARLPLFKRLTSAALFSS